MSERLEFIILHTNDLHSAFEAMPRIRTLFRAYEREQPPERLLRFDIGDHMDRMRLETEGTLGQANMDVLLATGYDAVVPGNNEGLTFTAEMLDELYARAAFPVLAANLVRISGGGSGGTAGGVAAGDSEADAAAAGDSDLAAPRTRRPSWLNPSVVLERAGVRFGLVGLTAAFDPFYKELGWRATDPLEAAAAEAARLRNDQAADVVVALSHLGLSYDRRLAESQAFDLVLGGHTHHVFEELQVIGDTYVGAAGKLGSHVGVVRLELDARTRRIVRCEGGARTLADVEPDAELERLIRDRAAAAERTLERVVAELDRPLPIELDRESPLGNLLAAALRRHCDADIGIVNAGQLLGGLERGPVTAAKLHAVCPSPINPCFMLLRGDRILEALEQSLDPAYTHRAIRGFGFRGERLGTLCFDGVAVTTAEDGTGRRRVAEAKVGGEPLSPDRLYRVGTIDMFTFRVGYESLADGTSVSYRLPEFLRDLLADALTSPERDRYLDDACRTRFDRLP